MCDLSRTVSASPSVTSNSNRSRSTLVAAFTDDGQVDFADFVLFALGFGSTEGDSGFEARFDLDRDGAVSFSDFLLFVEAFG